MPRLLAPPRPSGEPRPEAAAAQCPAALAFASDRVRLDPLGTDWTWVSVRADREGWLEPGPGILAREHAPSLDLALRLGGGGPGRLTLHPVEEAPRAEGPPAPPAGRPEEYRVAGALGVPAAQAGRLLAEGHALAWVELPRVYERLAAAERRWLGGVPGVADLVAAAGTPGRPPIEATPRMREAARRVLLAMLKPRHRCALVKGVAGVGKSALVELLARDLASMRVPARLQGVAMAALGTELFLPLHNASEERARAEARVELARHRVIWVIDEASRLVDRYGDTTSLDHLLLFIDLGARVILLSDRTSCLEKREAFVRRTTPCYLRPPELDEAVVITERVAAHQAGLAAVRTEPGVAEAAALASRSLPFALPHAAIEVVSHAIAEVEAAGGERVGRAEVERALEGLLAQGDEPPEPVGDVEDFVRRMRGTGFRGHGRFLRRFGQQLVGAREERRRSRGRRGAFLRALLVGPSGCGKSTFFRALGSVLVSSERKVMTIRGAAYAEHHGVQTLRGAPASYIGYDRGSLLGNFVKQAPNGLLVVEEPELAHPVLLTLLLEVLDGAFETGDGETVPTRGLAVLVATNRGLDRGALPVGFARGGAGERRRRSVVEALRSDFDPRLLSRFEEADAIHVLMPLGRAALRNIARLEAERFGRERGVAVRLEAAVAERLVEDAGSERERSGARAVVGQLRSRVLAPLGRLLAGESPAAVEARLDGRGEIVLVPFGSRPADAGAGAPARAPGEV